MPDRRDSPPVTPLRVEPPDLPPVNNQLEQLLLGALLADNERLADIGNLKAEHFAFAQNQRVFNAIRWNIERNILAVPKTLIPLLNGEASYVSDLASAAVTSTSQAVRHWASQVIALDHIRRLLALACDTPRVFNQAHGEYSYIPRLEAMYEEVDALQKAYRKDAPIGSELTLSCEEWERLDVADPDFLLGELVSTTSRLMLVGPTGLGKTNLLMAMGMAISLGDDFLHWQGCGQTRKVLFIDGDMPKRQLKRRIIDAKARCSRPPQTFYALSHEEIGFPLFFDTLKAQQFIDRLIERLGGVDLIIFDSINFLYTRDDSFGADSWAAAQEWRADLSRRAIGQVWLHHTGHDESHGYGTKTREWALDTVIMMEKTEDQSLVSFRLNFPKKRECGPKNYRDFEPATIILTEDDRWSSERGGEKPRHAGGRPNKLEDIALRALDEALAIAGEPGGHHKIPAGKSCVPRELWLKYFQQMYAGDGDPDSVKTLFRRYAARLQADGRVSAMDGRIWRT